MGLSVLFKARKRMEELSGVFMMVNLQQQIKKVFEVIKALPDMKIFTSMDEADAYLDKIQRGDI